MGTQYGIPDKPPDKNQYFESSTLPFPARVAVDMSPLFYLSPLYRTLLNKSLLNFHLVKLSFFVRPLKMLFVTTVICKETGQQRGSLALSLPPCLQNTAHLQSLHPGLSLSWSLQDPILP